MKDFNIKVRCLLEKIKSVIPGIGLMIFLLLMANVTYAAPKSDLWPKWEANNAESTEIINHQVWSKFLTEYLMNEHPSESSTI